MTMTNQEFINLIPDYILGQLTEDQVKIFEQYLRESDEAKAEMTSWKHLEQLDKIQQYEPSEKMDDRFYASLKDEIEKSNRDNGFKKFWNSFSSLFSKPQATWALPLTAMLLVIGFFLGSNWYKLNNTNENNGQELITQNSNEIDQVRAQLVMSLADQPYAGKRLQAISEVNKLNNATDQVIQALFKMLNTDSNVNVRLAAVTSLSNYVESAIVREGLVMSITQQESPMVQIALADLMVTLQEQESINSMEELLKKSNTNDVVRQKLEESINKII